MPDGQGPDGPTLNAVFPRMRWRLVPSRLLMDILTVRDHATIGFAPDKPGFGVTLNPACALHRPDEH